MSGGGIWRRRGGGDGAGAGGRGIWDVIEGGKRINSSSENGAAAALLFMYGLYLTRL
jgi:hypothetical protein